VSRSARARGLATGMVVALAALMIATAAGPNATAEEQGAIGATISLDQSALTATLYGAQGDVRVVLTGTVHIASDRGHTVNLGLSIEGAAWQSDISPASIRAQTDADFPFTAWVEVPRSASEGTYALLVRARDGNSLFPIDTQAAFTVSVFAGRLALFAKLDTPAPFPGETATWTLTLRNLGGTELDFVADFAVPAGFAVRATFPPVQTVAPGQDATVEFAITPPPTATAGRFEWSVTVTSNTDSSVSATLTAPFDVQRIAPAPPGTNPDFVALYWLPITAGLVAVGFVAYISLTEVGYLALAFSVLVPLFTRIRREKVLDNFTRGQIFGYIQANPGAHYSAIHHVLDVENGVLAYHLRVLLREDYIVARNEGVFKRFYPRDYKIPKRRTLLTRLQVDILEAVEKAPGTSQRDIAAALGESKQVVSYNVGVLRDAGLLTAERRGRDVTLRPSPQGTAVVSASEDDDLAAGPTPSDLAPL